MPTESEKIVTLISSNVFFAEFTFDKNQFKSSDGELELADNVLWLDDLLFVIQVKERNPSEVKTIVEENKWFENVTKKAKKQIGDSITFLKSYDCIKIKNLRNHEIEISKPPLDKVNKVIIYVPNSDLISEENRFTKFYESSQVGNVHIFHIEDYLWVCKYLITPTELDEYLKFRERIYLKHKALISVYPEQYVLSHFLNTPDVTVIRPEYIETLKVVEQDIVEWDMSGVIKHFPNNLVMPEGSAPNDYYSIIKEIAKLNRFELKHFKERFTKMIEDAKKDIVTFPYRFALSRINCGFVFIPLVKETVSSWRDALVTFTEILKYKWKLKRCLGVCAFYDGTHFDINWVFIERDWAFNAELDEAVERDLKMYGQGDIVDLGRYRFKDKEE